MADDEWVDVPAAPAPTAGADDGWTDVPSEPQPVSKSAMGAVKDAVEPVLNALGQGWREGWGPDRLGISDEGAKWLSKVGVFAPDGAKSYLDTGWRAPFYAFNELLAQTAWTTPEIMFRAGGGILRAGQQAVAEIGEQAGQPQLGRDIAAIPEAFFGSPHPTGMFKTPKLDKPRITGGTADAVDLSVARDLGVVGEPRKPITEGTPAEAAKNAVPPMEAYHGSPHSFDAFDSGKIGTGEGAQSYGHGLYFAEHPQVARDYQQKLAPRLTAKTMPVEVTAALRGLDNLGFDTPSEAIRAIRENQRSGENWRDHWDANQPQDAAAAAIIDKHIYETRPIEQGNLYQVRIHADRDAMLDWDKPLSEQSESVRNAIAGLEKKIKVGWLPTLENDLQEIRQEQFKNAKTGQDILSALERGTSRAEATRILREAGIPGIKYLDQGSRPKPGFLEDARRNLERMKEQGDPESIRLASEHVARLEAAQETRNFVVFDHNDVEITHKNGVPVERPLRAAAAEQKRPETKTMEPGGGGAVTDKAGNIRLDLIDKPDDVLNVIRQAAEEAGGDQAFMEARRGEIPLAQQEALSQASGIPVGDLDVRGMGRLMRNDNEVRAAITAMIQSAEDVSAAMKKAATTDAPEDLIEFQRLRMRHSVLQEQVAGLTAEWGRTGNVFQEFAERAKDAKGLGEFLKDKKGETLDDLREMAKAGSVLDREQMAKFLNDARRPPPSLMYWTWVNGLISGLLTHTKYVEANALYAATERGLITPIAAMIGKVKEISGVEAERVFHGEAFAGIYGMLASVPTSFMATAKSIKAGVRAPLESEVLLREAAIARGEKVPASLENANNPVTQNRRPTSFRIPIYDRIMGNEERPINQIYARIIGAPGDAAMGIHTFFKIMGERAGIEEEAYRAAVKEGLSPANSEFWERRADLAANPTEAMRERALEGAYKGTFMQELGPRGRAWQKFTKETPGLKWLFPFSHIPVNLMKATYEYTPFAFLDGEMRANITGKNGGIAQDRAIARMVVGSAIMGYFTNLQMTGQATGDYPQDPKERDHWKLTGMQPNSVKINGYWVSYDKFGPAGSLANIGANIGAVVHHLKSDDDEAMTKATWHAADAAAHIVVNEVGFMSLQNLFEAIHDEKKGAAWAASTAGSFIPFSSFLSQNASFMDPSMREAKTFVDGLKYRIPVARETLLPKRDWSGTPVANPQYGNIIRQRQASTDPVDLEMDRLGIHPAPPENRIGGVKLPAKMYDVYQSTAGPFTRQALENIVTQPGWQDLPPFVREETIRGTIKATRAAAAAAMQAKYPQIIQQGIENRVNHLTGQKPTALREQP